MAGFKPVTVSKNAFAFCRYTIAILVWLAFLFKIKELLVVVFVILLFSAIFKIRKAPLILAYNYTVGRKFPGENIVLDEKGMRFAHTVGAVMSGLCVLLFYLGFTVAAMLLTFALAILKSSAAFGFCSASKLYSCLNSGGDCCRIGWFARKLKNARHS